MINDYERALKEYPAPDCRYKVYIEDTFNSESKKLVAIYRIVSYKYIEGSKVIRREAMTQEEVFTLYHNKIENYIYFKVSDRYLAEDIASAVFLKIYQKLDDYDDSKASISTWIYTIANNTLIDYFRTRKVTEEVPEDIAAMGEIDEELIREEMLNELAKALKKLSEKERDLIILRYYDNLTLKDISVKMGISYAYAKIIHAKAISSLRESMGIDNYLI